MEIPVGTDVLSMLKSADLTSVDRSFPVLEAGTCKVRIQKFDTKPTKDKSGHILTIDLVLAEPRKTDPADGEQPKLMNPGFKFQDSIPLVRTEKYNPLEKLADIQNAVFGEQRQGFNFPDYVNQEVTVRLTVEDDPEYGRRNRVRYLRRKGTTGIGSAPAQL